MSAYHTIVRFKASDAQAARIRYFVQGQEEPGIYGAMSLDANSVIYHGYDPSLVNHAAYALMGMLEEIGVRREP